MATSKKSTKKLVKRAKPAPPKAENAATDAPEQEAPETLLYEVNGNKAIRVLHPEAVVFVEKNDGTIDLVAKDRIPYFFRRSSNDIAYSPQGFDVVPEDSAAYVTIEEIEAELTEVSEGDRERAQEAQHEDEHREKAPDSSVHHAGVLTPPTPRETAPAPAEKKAEPEKAADKAKHTAPDEKKK